MARLKPSRIHPEVVPVFCYFFLFILRLHLLFLLLLFLLFYLLVSVGPSQLVRGWGNLPLHLRANRPTKTLGLRGNAVVVLVATVIDLYVEERKKRRKRFRGSGGGGTKEKWERWVSILYTIGERASTFVGTRVGKGKEERTYIRMRRQRKPAKGRRLQNRSPKRISFAIYRELCVSLGFVSRYCSLCSGTFLETKRSKV